MKTPREILLARYRAAEPKLDDIRAALLKGLNSPSAQPRAWVRGGWHLRLQFLEALWRELILPNRRIWSALATVWLFLFILNVSQREPAGRNAGRPVGSLAIMMNWEVQQRWMDELLADRSAAPPTDPPPSSPLRPRTGESVRMAA